MRWAARQRQDFIRDTLKAQGYINRSALQGFFGISVQQASHDLKVYASANPGAMRYDVSSKRYVNDDFFQKRSKCPHEYEPTLTGRMCSLCGNKQSYTDDN